VTIAVPGDTVKIKLTTDSSITRYGFRLTSIVAKSVPGTSGTSGDDANPWRYRGEYLDLETHTYYLRARSYQPTIGRFLTEDPAHDGMNWYVYAANNPVMYTDSTGLKAQSESRSDGKYTLYVSPQWLDLTQSAIGWVPAIGWGFSIGNWAGQRLAGYRDIKYDAKNVLGLAAGGVELISSDMVKAASKWAGTALSVAEAGTYLYDWFYSKSYQIEEAIYNQFDRSVWDSNSRNIVDQKFNYAMQSVTYMIATGKIEVRKAVDVFGINAFTNGRAWQYDPLIGSNRYYQQDDYYFFMIDGAILNNEIANLEKAIKQGALG